MKICDNGIYRDTTQEEDAQFELEHAQFAAEQEQIPLSAEAENATLLQYVNDKTNGNYTELGEAVKDLVNNN